MIQLIKSYRFDIVLAVAVILISVISFNLGKVSAFKNAKTPITITEPAKTSDRIGAARSFNNSAVVASKNSKEKLYHFSWCSGASRIAEKNKIIFPTEAAALAAGYTLAGNCQR